jgi:RNA polymerase sigma-70 factor (ECF subfamily)
MNTLDFQTQVAQSHAILSKYAMLQLRNSTWVEDIVSDVIVTALNKPSAFSGQSSVQTWLIGILKFKLIDHFRHSKKEYILNSYTDLDNTHNEEDSFIQLEQLLFNDQGESIEPQALWTNPSQSPDASLQEKQFFTVLDICVNDLPASQGRVFMMREWLDLPTAQICEELQISSSNLWTLLHRARTRLQVCLNNRWFNR